MGRKPPGTQEEVGCQLLLREMGKDWFELKRGGLLAEV